MSICRSTISAIRIFFAERDDVHSLSLRQAIADRAFQNEHGHRYADSTWRQFPGDEIRFRTGPRALSITHIAEI